MPQEHNFGQNLTEAIGSDQTLNPALVSFQLNKYSQLPVYNWALAHEKKVDRPNKTRSMFSVARGANSISITKFAGSFFLLKKIFFDDDACIHKSLK